ncbi:MAG: hypothetical protein K2Q18_05775, partial [Bdellovibrionales bacterium]|nr:hypothetical protein [Bdellovibrionales bacterium]
NFAYAEIVQLAEDELVKESEAALKCPGLELISTSKQGALSPAPVIKPQVKAPTVEVTTEVSVEDIERPFKGMTPTEKLKAYRTRLEESNLVLLEKKMELMRLQQEMNLLKNLERSMNQTLSAIDILE